jgi:hypothetical protein
MTDFVQVDSYLPDEHRLSPPLISLNESSGDTGTVSLIPNLKRMVIRNY